MEQLTNELNPLPYSLRAGKTLQEVETVVKHLASLCLCTPSLGELQNDGMVAGQARQVASYYERRNTLRTKQSDAQVYYTS